MVNVLKMIRREKEKFRNYQDVRQRSRIMEQTAKLEAEKVRAGEIAKLNARKQTAQRDVEKLQEYNQKIEGPSKFQQFGAGLTKTIGQGSEKLKEFKKTRKSTPKGNYKGENLRSVNRGSGINFGGSGRDPFAMGGGSPSFGSSGPSHSSNRDPFAMKSSGGSSPFGFSQDKPKEEKKKERGITIKIN
jgi:hypothetical protein